MRSLSSPLALIATFVLAGAPLFAADAPAPPDPLQTAWKHARTRIEKVLADQGRTPEAIENPKWFEQPYVTAGRMPLVDTALAEPLVLPEILGWADAEAAKAKGSLSALLALADTMANQAVRGAPGDGVNSFLRELREGHETIMAVYRVEELRKVEALASLPEPALAALSRLLVALDTAHRARERAFAALTPDERATAGALLPGYFVKKTPAGETVRGYTAPIDDCAELIALLRRVDFPVLLAGANAVAGALDGLRAALDAAPAAAIPPKDDEILAAFDAPFGKVVVAGTGPNTHAGDFALILDLGGDDVYRGGAGATRLEGQAVSVVVDLSGNDRYLGEGLCQGAALCGVAALLDRSGDDAYLAGHYAQGAALGGFALFCDEAGDDTYTGGLGVQGFALFGYAIFHEGGGRDSYRCASMGQGCASTLGVAVLDEAGGDDVYRSGGKHGFYESWDASCAQGAASGMRPWPPHGKITVYGGVGFLRDAAGNDSYHSYIIGQGGSYLLGLGLFADDAGDDLYSGLRYTRGVGVHLGAAAALDRAGDDVYIGDYGQNAMSLDRSAGVFLDLAGNDVYRVKAGLGYDIKPRGFSAFVDASGDDVYDGPRAILGHPAKPWSEDTESTAFFFDLGGRDRYPADAEGKDDAQWTQRAFGFGEDVERGDPLGAKRGWWAPEIIAPVPGPLPAPAERLCSASTFERFAAKGLVLESPQAGLDALLAAARNGHAFARRDCIDPVRVWILKGLLKEADGERLLPLLDSADRELRLLGCFALMQIEAKGIPVAAGASALALHDASEDVRGMACIVLGKTGSRHALEPLRRVLWQSSSSSVRRRAVLGLKDLKSPEAAADLAAVLEKDPAPEVRGRAAEALGALRDEAAVSLLHKALLDPEGIVRFFAARSLLVDFGRAEGMEPLFALARWDGGPLRDTLVWTFLKAYTGQTLPGNEAAWRAWWETAGRDFDARSHGEVFELCGDAEAAERKGDADGAVAIYRAIRARVPRHAGACEKLADVLNGRAWNIAVAGGDAAEGLKLAEESVDAKAGANNLDTLAVLQFLAGKKEAAAKTLEEAIPGFKGAERAMLEGRLAEIRKGKIEIH